MPLENAASFGKDGAKGRPFLGDVGALFRRSRGVHLYPVCPSSNPVEGQSSAVEMWKSLWAKAPHFEFKHESMRKDSRNKWALT